MRAAGKRCLTLDPAALDETDHSRTAPTVGGSVAGMRLQLAPDPVTAATLADEDGDGFDDETGEPVDPADEAPADAAPADDGEEAGLDDGQRRWVLAVEGKPTGDDRTFEAFTWRELPLPFMATDITSDGHDGARLVANIVSIERVGNEIIGITQDVVSDVPEVIALQQRLDDGSLRGVSVDLDMVEGYVEMDITDDDKMDEESGTIRIPLGDDRYVFTSARIMGATAVPFPAFQEAQQLRAALVAGAMTLDTAQTQPVDLVAPVSPPADWFADPRLSTPTPITVTSDGRLFGHVALWNSCHRGMSECTPPPRNRSGKYDHFHTGELRTADGSTVRVGHITCDGGHADERLGIQPAKQHYDDTGWTAADVTIGEDGWGIYAAGAIVPDLDDLRLRKLMSHDVSGDWRAFNGVLELISVRTVPVPGFVKTVYASGQVTALIASVPVCEQDLDPALVRVANRIAASIGRTREQVQGERDSIAFRLGRHPAQRRQELAARVHGG